MKTQGTNLFFIDAENNVVVQLGCPTAINGVSSPREQRDITCLESEDKEFEPGMRTPGAANVSINFDSSNPSHVRMWELFDEGVKFDLAIGFSDGVSIPTLDSNQLFDFPTDRTFLTYEAYVADYPFEFALNANVVSGLVFQLSGQPDLAVKTS